MTMKPEESKTTLEWTSVDDCLPVLGQRVILFANGVIQNESFIMDEADVSDLRSERFWSRDDLDECPKIESGQFWMPWPTKRPRLYCTDCGCPADKNGNCTGC